MASRQLNPDEILAKIIEDVVFENVTNHFAPSDLPLFRESLRISSQEILSKFDAVMQVPDRKLTADEFGAFMMTLIDEFVKVNPILDNNVLMALNVHDPLYSSHYVKLHELTHGNN